MKKFRGIGAAGLSLVELIISMAILAVVGTAVGGAMYVSSRSYTRGSAEVNVQEEAQVASNLICDWIVDATDVNPDGSGGFIDGESTTLTIIHPDSDKKVQIVVEQSGTNLVYTATDVTDPSDPSYGTVLADHKILASNVTGVKFVSTFGSDRNVKISIDFNVNERTYHSVTDTTSRSHDFISSSGTSVLGAPIIRFSLVSNDGGAHVTLEPGQNTDSTKYTFYVFVDNCDADTLVFNPPTVSGTPNTSMTFDRVSGTNSWKCVVSSDDSADHDDTYTFTCSNAGGSDTKSMSVRIRKVQACEFTSYDLEDLSDANSRHFWSPTTGDTGAAGSTYDNVILLDPTNWQQELAIVDSVALEPGKNGWDASPWTYIDPTHLVVKFMGWDGTNYVDKSADVSSYTIGTGPNPSIHVVLANDIDYDLGVLVVADHSGSLSATAEHLGVSVTSNNKARFHDSRNLSYGDNGEAFYDIIWIGEGNNNHVHNVGGGFRRGVPACMIADFDGDFLTDLVDQIRVAGHFTSNSQITGNNSRIKYCTVIEYRPIDPSTGLGVGSFQRFVLANFSEYSLITSDYIAQRVRSSQSAIFKFNTSYEIVYNFDVYIDGVKKINIQEGGKICAVTPYFYDPNWGGVDSANFKNGKYDFDHPLTLTGSGEQAFGVYFDGAGLNNSRIDFYCEKWDGHNWVRVDNAVRYNDQAWAEGPMTIDGVYYDEVRLEDGRSYDVGNYVENHPDQNNSHANLEFINIKKDNLDSGTIYRIVFDTNVNEANSISQASEGNGDRNSYSQVGSYVSRNYKIVGDFYFTI